MMKLSWMDPRQTVLIELGYGLDIIGAMPSVDLPRNEAEPDSDYRGRLSVKLWASRGPMIKPITLDEYEKYKGFYDSEEPCEIFGNLWLVRSIEIESGPTWAGQIGVVPYLPLRPATP